MNIDQARLLAYYKNLDLVQINSNVNPPVCKYLDYGKFLYEKTKQVQKQKSKQKTSETKEIVLGVNIDKHDLDVKARRALEFFANNHKVIISVKLKGRQNIFSDRARTLIEEFRVLTKSVYEQNIKKVGNRFFAIIKKA